MMRVRLVTISTVALLLAPLSHDSVDAQVGVFLDTFDSEPLGLGTTTLANWTVTAGSVDVIGPGFFDLYPGNGRYLDMDGSFNLPNTNATIVSAPLNLDPGCYRLSFEMGQNAFGNPFPVDDNGLQVSLGAVFSQLFPAPFPTSSTATTLTLMTFQFRVDTPTTASLVFQETGTATEGGSILDDVLLVRIDSDCDGVDDDVDVCLHTVIPEATVPSSGRLNPNHWALLDGDFEFDTVKKGKGKGAARSFTTEDTGGCSCEQIIDALGLGRGHVKHGCSNSAMDTWVALVNL